MNMAWFLMKQSSACSHKRDLQESHNEIEKRESRIRDLLKSSLEIRVFQALQCFNCVLASLYEWMDEVLMFNWLWIHRFEISPLLCSCFEQLQFARIHLNLAWILLSDDARWWIKQGNATWFEEIERKKWEKSLIKNF